MLIASIERGLGSALVFIEGDIRQREKGGVQKVGKAAWRA